ncbi:glycosyltransferase [Gloeocapsopsis dulcis]|uniref:Colanic acid biosynthesis glycosyltransferase WcaL n=1 Tax=Gloeocapsopsis dulcis AAB1 = 1H9 TaxID=1433147 RepID=A0A6N8FYA3_9CHRO|nr:glycosyltransferase [Gloeocapsopsis dulcis]MUL38118.1 colanic acid biosynthesis glycosyltransferase WcaL [Gloeocapsopsis dulcis AAB1 = 1H9]WNN89380.1 glycosyltransferase [Gloeocapsopsis dulcis]
MRVLFIVGSFPAISETFVLNQITGLIDRGHEVDIYALNRPENTAKVHPDVENYHLLERTYYAPERAESSLIRMFQACGLLLASGCKHPIGLLRALSLFKNKKQLKPIEWFHLMVPFLGKQPYDIIHCQFGIYALKGMLLRDIGAIKGRLVTSFRGFDISWYVQEYGEDVYNELFKKGDFFLSNCEYFRQRVINFGCNAKKIVVLGSGINCERFFFKPRFLDNGKIRITTTGRLVEKKGMAYSIRAVAKLAETYPNIEYKIIGDGVLKTDLQNLIEELNVSYIVKLLGWKNQQEIIEILDNSHIFVATSVTAKDGNQDAPVNTLKEAMAMGLPVIGTNHGGIPELVEDGISGFLVPERDVETLAEKIAYLCDRPEIWQQMGQAGRAYVEQHYDTNKLNDQLVQIYEQVLSNEDTNSAKSPSFKEAIA